MGRASNNGATTQTLSTLPTTNSTVRISTTTNLSSFQNNVKQSSINHSQPSENLSNNNLITTTNVILDYLLFLSINTRINQTKNDLNQKLSLNNKKGYGVDAIVEGLLQSHRTQASSMLLPLPLKHRLYLCQLLHLVFDRSYISTLQNSTSNTSKLNNNNLSSSKLNTTTTATTAAATTTTTSSSSPRNISNSSQKSHKLSPNLVKYEKHFKNPLLSRCRKHRKSICKECQQDPSNSSIIPPMTRRRSTPPKPIPTRRTAPGLIDAIPVFLNTCAITYRLDNDNESMPIKPYELLLDLLTQAAIECYLCDSYSSIDALLEIFSYGNIDPSDYHSDDSESEDDDDPHFAATRADDYLLWQRTTHLDEFRQKKKDRMEEFLNVKGKLEQHFETLANKYPIRDFEIEMLNYCEEITRSLEHPALITGHQTNGSNELFNIPGRYNGGIDIPMSDDEYNDDFKDFSDNNILDGKKRRLSESDKSKETTKRNKSIEINK